MSISKKLFFECIREFRFKEMFNELGWDHAIIAHPVKVDEEIHSLTAIAQKKDFLIFLCSPTGDTADFTCLIVSRERQ